MFLGSWESGGSISFLQWNMWLIILRGSVQSHPHHLYCSPVIHQRFCFPFFVPVGIPQLLPPPTTTLSVSVTCVCQRPLHTFKGRAIQSSLITQLVWRGWDIWYDCSSELGGGGLGRNWVSFGQGDYTLHRWPIRVTHWPSRRNGR